MIKGLTHWKEGTMGDGRSSGSRIKKGWNECIRTTYHIRGRGKANNLYRRRWSIKGRKEKSNLPQGRWGARGKGNYRFSQWLGGESKKGRVAKSPKEHSPNGGVSKTRTSVCFLFSDLRQQAKKGGGIRGTVKNNYSQ